MNERTLMDVAQRAARVGLAAIGKWGLYRQIDQLLEEMAELQQILLHAKRGRATTGEVLEEMVDVLIVIAGVMANYLHLHCGTGLVGVVINMAWHKLDRLEDRIAHDRDHEPATPRLADVMMEAAIAVADDARRRERAAFDLVYGHFAKCRVCGDGQSHALIGMPCTRPDCTGHYGPHGYGKALLA